MGAFFFQSHWPLHQRPIHQLAVFPISRLLPFRSVCYCVASCFFAPSFSVSYDFVLFCFLASTWIGYKATSTTSAAAASNIASSQFVWIWYIVFMLYFTFQFSVFWNSVSSYHLPSWITIFIGYKPSHFSFQFICRFTRTRFTHWRISFQTRQCGRSSRCDFNWHAKDQCWLW